MLLQKHFIIILFRLLLTQIKKEDTAMKKQYTMPDLLVLTIQSEDIFTNSGEAFDGVDVDVEIFT